MDIKIVREQNNWHINQKFDIKSFGLIEKKCYYQKFKALGHNLWRIEIMSFNSTNFLMVLVDILMPVMAQYFFFVLWISQESCIVRSLLVASFWLICTGNRISYSDERLMFTYVAVLQAKCFDAEFWTIYQNA